MQAGVWVTVRLADGSEHAGFVHAVDPETGNAVLLQPVHPEQARAPALAQLTTF